MVASTRPSRRLSRGHVGALLSRGHVGVGARLSRGHVWRGHVRRGHVLAHDDTKLQYNRIGDKMLS